MRKIFIALALPALLAACGSGNGSPSQASGACSPQTDGSEFGAGIVNGKTLKAQSPLASRTVILIFKNGDATEECTGSLLPNNIILTAAHCAQESKIAVGFTNSLECSVDSTTGRKVTQRLVHPDYKNERDWENDIAMLKFSGSVPAGYQSYELPDENLSPKADENLVMLGYGTNVASQKSDGNLRVTSNRGSRLHTSGLNYLVEQPETGICYGDSGGALVVVRNLVPKIVGIAAAVGNNSDKSKEKQCSGLSVFVRTDTKAQWIRDSYRQLTR